MGGPGSGRWNRSNKKATVEDSLTIAIWDLCGRGRSSSGGTITWSWGIGRKAAVGYRFSWPYEPTVTLYYGSSGGEKVELPIRLQMTPTSFDGHRWWLTCPLIGVAGDACRRRVAKLHLPPGARYFGCRKCYDLTYQSCQEAHAGDLVDRIDRMENWMEALKKRGA